MFHSNIIRFLAILSLLSVASYSFPHQLVLNAQNDIKSYSSEVSKGDDASDLIWNAVSSLNTGYPGGWENLVRDPAAWGSSNHEIVSGDHIDQTVDEWNLDARIRNRVYEDVQLLVDLHAQEATFVSQEFRYNVPGCNEGPLPVCLFTVIVVARRILPAETRSDIIELHHLYIAASSNAIQQTMPHETCHNCWLRRCCHWQQVPRQFTAEESRVILSVLSTTSARWATEHIQTDIDPPSFGNDVSVPDMLRQLVKNSKENKDVFKAYDNFLLSSLQGSMESSQQRTRSINLSIQEQNIPVIGKLLASCLKDAEVDKSLEELWRESQETSPGKPLSLECQHLKMERDIENPPPKECNKSALVTVDSQYFWTILSPHPNSIECVFIGSNTRVVQRDCEQQKEPKDPSKKGLTISHCHWNGKQKPQVEEGMVVRVSIPEQDGHFSSVQYLAQMSEYNDEHNKALLDIVRYACAHAFLKVPIPRINPSQVELDEILRPFTVHNMGLLDSIGAISAGLGSIADAWSKLSNAFGSRVTETVRRRICLGFSRYEHTVTGSVARSIPLKLFGEVVDALIKVAKVKNKDVDELREIMIILELTDDMTWKGQTSSYTSSDGFHRFFHFYKYVNQTTNTVDIVFGNLAADFTIAPDTLIIDKNKVSWGGLSREQTTVFRDVPHVITMDDAALLNTYFEVVAYRHIAAVLREPVPPYPSLGGACSEV